MLSKQLLSGSPDLQQKQAQAQNLELLIHPKGNENKGCLGPGISLDFWSKLGLFQHFACNTGAFMHNTRHDVLIA